MASLGDRTRPFRVYVDTSVVGGCLDPEFATDSRRVIDAARLGWMVLLISALLADELESATEQVQGILPALPSTATEFVPITAGVIALRDAYLAAGIVGPRSRNDATHVAAATVARADAIVSWNFRDIVRLDKMGLMPELGSTRLLAQIVGLGNATDMCLTGRWVEAQEALRISLVSAVVPNDALLDTALARAEEIAGNPTTAVMMIKELLAKNPTDPDLDAVMEREQLRDEIARRLPDHLEAVTAFREKREPRFNQG